jgi:putative Mg2+ transporter-C (MgtC) family protein
VDAGIPVDFVWRLTLAAAFGAVLGLEREYRRKPAGLRTHILIAVGSALFTVLSLEMTAHGEGDPSRVAGQIVTGIGFLGGGAIMRYRDTVHGMTTAATIWVNAAIGVATGAGQLAIASFATALTLVVLIVLPPVENYFDRRAGVPEHREPHSRR